MSAEDFDNKVQGTTDDHRYHGVNGATRDFGMNQVPTRTDDGIHIHGTNLNKMVTMSPEMFEKLYLTPKVPNAGRGNKRYANPTPLGLMGFVISAMTFGLVLLNVGGANGNGSALAGMFLFTAPVLQVLSVVFEWIMGNFLPMMVYGLFAVFWLSLSFTQLPTLRLASAYSPTMSEAEGLASKQFNATLAIYLCVWGFGLLMFTVFTLKTNIVYFTVFLWVTIAAWLLSGSYWKASAGDPDYALRLQKAGGAFLFGCGALGWYLLIVMMAAELRFPCPLPVGDLSRFWHQDDVEVGVKPEAQDKQA